MDYVILHTFLFVVSFVKGIILVFLGCDILNVEPSSKQNFWELAIDESSPIFPGAINYFLTLLEPKLKILASLCDVRAEDISIWYLHEYEGQCNMEFSLASLMLLDSNGISLCPTKKPLLWRRHTFTG